MIKKILSTFLFASSVIIASAQCTPDISCFPAANPYGICPDSTTGLKHGTVNVPYTETVSIKVPSTTDAFGVPGGTVSNIVIDDVVGLEPNLTYKCTPSTCTFPGNSTGCALISGTPTQVWDQPIIVKITANITIFGLPQAVKRDLTGYRCIVDAATGIEQLSYIKFDVGQNIPNPFNGKSEIRFNAVNNGSIDFKVYNMLGAVVYSTNFKADKGQNIIAIEANSFAPGVYVYSVGSAEKTITKRMIVAR
jgi:hypothetical protein